MRTDTAQPIRLQDYRPPDWLVETVSLDVSLHPTQTKVRATLKLRPNPANRCGAAGARRRRAQAGVAQARRRQAAAATAIVATPDRLTIPQPPNRPFTLEIETLVDPTANTQLSGLYRSSGTYCTQCEAEGFRRITYFPDRPDVMAVYTHAHRGRQSGSAGAARQRQSRRERRPARTAGISRSGTIRFRKPSYLFALVGGDLGLRRGPVSSPCRAAR